MMVMVVEMMMMIPMKPSSMTVTMAMISPLRGGIFLADFSLPVSFSLFVVFRPIEAVEYFLDAPRVLGFLGDEVLEGGCQWWARASTPYGGAARGGPVPPHGVGHWWPTTSPCLR